MVVKVFLIKTCFDNFINAPPDYALTSDVRDGWLRWETSKMRGDGWRLTMRLPVGLRSKSS